jgi:RNA polymerase sigma-70 factor (ECF subfamily)
MSGLALSMCQPVREHATETPMKALPRRESSRVADVDVRRIASGVARGDEASFRELYDRYQNRVFRLALVIGRGDESLAHETVQSVFLTAASKLRRVENEEHLWNWLARVARQHISKTWRQERNSATVSVAELPEQAGAEESDSQLEQKLDAALLALDPEDQELIERFYFDDLSHKVIAERLNVTQKAVSCRLERARARLRSLLARKQYEP